MLDEIWYFWMRVCVKGAARLFGAEAACAHLKAIAVLVAVLSGATWLATRLLCFAVAAFVAFCLARGCFGAP